MIDAKYLAEIKARLDAGRIPMKSDMEALLAEVERLTKENQGLRANSEVQESIISGGRNPADKEQIVRLTMDNAAKDQQIAMLKKSNATFSEENHGLYGQIATLKKALEQEGTMAGLKHCRNCKFYDPSRFAEYQGKLAICMNPHSGAYKLGYGSLAGDCFEPKEEADRA